ncbi:ABC transporter ATP-binding protein [Cohnella thailandensis]|uniref:ABC transporter ATP-binding protein n=1 Tax=Cohnella thailandensis TaxID=557557 RepID=A0A841SYG8_9BACL|nr:ABC transporter ATP-binding protein [Cohnella thailandensis]MBB6636954.1 ABC transporter ATP-binding protein [Cohnella thailandensis]MBP1973163.1 ABC-2 type transport system ATP-binding protein [Cohnella thailandensis]
MIEVDKVSKGFARKKVLRDVSFTVEKGQIVCLIGLNGAGKSTILKAIMGLTPIRSGRILVDGKKPDRRLYERIGYVPDHLTMPSSMRAVDALTFMEDFYPNWNASRAAELMSFFGLDFKERIGNLSKGTAAKLNLVLGLALDSDYILMDEPFSGIDLFSRERIAELFSGDMIDGRGVLLTTHEVGDIEHLIDKAVILNKGVVARSFDCDRVREEEGKSVVDMMREVLQA